MNFYIVFLKEIISYGYCILIAIITTCISIVLCLCTHNAFIKSFNEIENNIEIDVKAIDDSTMLDGKIKENYGKTEFNDYNLVTCLALSMMISLGSCFLSFFHASIAENEILGNAVVQICINFAVDSPLRIIAAKIFQKIRFCKYYEIEYPPLYINISSKAISKLKLREIIFEERRDHFRINDITIPLDYSGIYSPKVQRSLENSSENMINNLSENNFSEPEQEICAKHLSDRSIDTVASHNILSEEENIQ